MFPRVVTAAFEVFATFDVRPIDFVRVVEFDGRDIVPEIFLGVPMLLAVTHMQDSFLLVEHLGPGSADIELFGEDLRFLAPFPVAVALRTAMQRAFLDRPRHLPHRSRHQPRQTVGRSTD